MHGIVTSSSAIAERPRCRVGQLWPKVEDDILHTTAGHPIRDRPGLMLGMSKRKEISGMCIENLYSPSKHGRQQTISNTNEINSTDKNTQSSLQI